MNSIDEENASILIWYNGLELDLLLWRSSSVAFPIIQAVLYISGHYVCGLSLPHLYG